MRRRDFIGLLALAAVPARGAGAAVAQTAPLFPGVELNHINLRTTNCGRTALFYHGLFGGELLYVHSVSPNPSTPPVESWFVNVGSHFLSITPVFPHLQLGVDLDHISPSVRGFKSEEEATRLVKARGLTTVAGSGRWLRDPDGMIWQLTDVDVARAQPGPPRPPFSQVLLAAQERQGRAFAPAGISDLTLRVADVKRTGEFLLTVFGGEVTPRRAGVARTFVIGRCAVHLAPRAPGTPHGTWLESMAVAVDDFNALSARQALEQRGLQVSDGRDGGVAFVDPEGIRVYLSGER